MERQKKSDKIASPERVLMLLKYKSETWVGLSRLFLNFNLYSYVKSMI